MNKFHVSILIVLTLQLCPGRFALADVPQAISLQGTLENSGGSPVTGVRDYRVRFFDSATDGVLIGTVTGTVVLSGAGRFSIEFIPPQEVLEANEVWYELGIDAGVDGIDPNDVFPERVRIQSVPFALLSGNAEQLGGIPAISYLPSAQVWTLNGNEISPGQYLGTTNQEALEFRVDGQAALRLIPNATNPNIVGGHPLNKFLADVDGGVIAGGGAGDYPVGNQVSGDYGAIVGGAANEAASYAFVGGGENNFASGDKSVIAGGSSNRTSGEHATVAGGNNNDAISPRSVVSGGAANEASGTFATISGGENNRAIGTLSTVTGGWSNTATGFASIAAGGTLNVATGAYSFAAGRRANALHQGSFVWADSQDEDFLSTANDQFLVRASGGIHLTVNDNEQGLRILKPNVGPPNIIGGDGSNEVFDEVQGGAVLGGYGNSVTEHYATVGGGYDNQAGDGEGAFDSAYGATVSGGNGNIASGGSSMVPGGYRNKAEGSSSFAAGHEAEALHDGTFVWADLSGVGFGSTPFLSTQENQFAIRATNGMWLSKNAPPDKEVEFGEYYRDNSILAWAKVAGNGTVNASRGVESVTHVDDGVYRLTLTDGAANANTLIPVANAEIDDTPPEAAADLRIVSINQRNFAPYNTFDVYINRGTGALVDNDFVFLVTGR